MTGIIYRPDLPHPDHNILLIQYSTRLPYVLFETMVARVAKTNSTLEVAIYENHQIGRLVIARRMMLEPLLSHWHTLRFSNIAESEREALQTAMQEVRSGIKLCMK